MICCLQPIITCITLPFIDSPDDTATLGKITNLGGGIFSIKAEPVSGEDGVFTLPDGLVLVPPADYNGPITLNVSALSQDDTASSLESVSESLTFELAPVSEEPELSVQDASGSEDTPILLSVTPTKADVNGVLDIQISGVPDGAELGTFDGSFTKFLGKDDGEGTFTLAESDLTNLAIKPAPNDSSDISLNVSIRETSGSDIASDYVDASISVTVEPVSDISKIDAAEDSDISEDAYQANGMPFYDFSKGKYFKVTLGDLVGDSEELRLSN